MKKTCVSLLLTLVLLVCAAAPLAQAEEEGIMPLGYNYNSCSITLSISSSGLATMRVMASGKENYIEKITANVYLQKQSGSTWVRVQSVPVQWTASTSTASLDKTFTYQLTSKGTYRAVATFSFTGTYPGHATESEVKLDTATY